MSKRAARPARSTPALPRAKTTEAMRHTGMVRASLLTCRNMSVEGARGQSASEHARSRARWPARGITVVSEKDEVPMHTIIATNYLLPGLPS